MEGLKATTTIVKSPITGEVLYKLDDYSVDDLKGIMDTARQMQPIIKAMSLDDRIKEVDKILRYVLDNKDFILDQVIAETGKSRTDAYAAEVFEICDVIDVYKKMAPKVLADSKVKIPIFLMGKKARQWKEPLGTVMVITPWNFPFYQVIVPGILAFLAGNSVIVKPSEWTPLKPLWEHLFKESGFLKDAIQIVCGGKTAGAELIKLRPNKVHFTGSVRTGKKVMALCAEQLTPVDLELGGKDPSIVFDDVNIDRTVNGVMWGAFTNAGQNCTGIERLYVQDTIYDKFVGELVAKTKLLKTSHPGRNTQVADDCDVGAITADFQVALIEDHIEDAIKKGANLLCGGIREKGSHHILPTIFDNCTKDMKIATEETFGPTVAIFKFRTEEEVIQMANDSPYGLGGSVWTSDLKRGERVARALVVGNVCINNHMINEANPYLPFGGIKDSGIGRFKGEGGLLTFCNLKSVIIEKQSDLIELQWYPFTKEKGEILDGLTTSYFGKPRKWVTFLKNALKSDSIGKKQKL